LACHTPHRRKRTSRFGWEWRGNVFSDDEEFGELLENLERSLEIMLNLMMKNLENFWRTWRGVWR